jgi:predicted nucleic acid-binding protein
MALDVLLAVNARRHEVTLVTDNWRDFNAIQYYCNFKLASGAEFLAK